MSRYTELNCSVCGSLFKRYVKEHNRNVKLGRKEVCTPKCCGKLVEDNLGKFKGAGDVSCFGSYFGHRNGGGKKIDEFSPFRYYAQKTKWRKVGSKIT